MTTDALPRSAAPTRSALGWAVRDTMAVAGRNLIVLRRVPQLLVFSTIQPILFVVMFRYVFGGEIHIPGVKNYVDYLMPGIFGQTVAFGAISTGIGLSEDLGKGLIERFKSLPMARSAVLAGRTLADLCRNVFVVTLMVGMGVLVGFRPHRGVPALVGGLALLLLFGFALSWLFAIVGLTVPNAETAQAAAFPLIFPLVFASSAFVRVENMPGWMQAFAKNQPVTATVNAVRALALDSTTAERLIGDSTAHLVLKSLAWSLAILVVAAPLAVRRYRRVA
jgi:ABC-2 type transport system permease protein/oleandomycin transport system permease protein